jgi:hypothetical protein
MQIDSVENYPLSSPQGWQQNLQAVSENCDKFGSSSTFCADEFCRTNTLHQPFRVSYLDVCMSGKKPIYSDVFKTQQKVFFPRFLFYAPF